MADGLSDEQKGRLNDRLDEFKRRVKNGNIDYDRAMDALDRMIHRYALSISPFDTLCDSDIITNFGATESIVAANLLELNGFIVNLGERRIESILRSTGGTTYDAGKGIFMDVSNFRNRTLRRGINVGWRWHMVGDKLDHVAEVVFFDHPSSQKLKKWPEHYDLRIKDMATHLKVHLDCNHALRMETGVILTI